MPNENAGDKPPNETPSSAEWALMNAFLASQGYTPAQRQEAIGLTPNGRSRLDIGNDLKTWIKNN